MYMPCAHALHGCHIRVFGPHAMPTFYLLPGTLNEVNKEFEEQGHPGQYEHISVVENLRAPNLDTIKTASALERGTGKQHTLRP